ncbi:hypothetical protein AOXY_G12028 [Acipenser oxyrinchus oxyrinchus]|uniref:Uncharacterized protein n=1 Tax=Acipenser oxyrinchus oxyrinchus TaxID=40147 RepID=A0AAD8DBQ4_ACIOX|nr:hypothetical protein AOXY_G12028 [Acipenser oxyrinchus oxyrinchus]
MQRERDTRCRLQAALWHSCSAGGTSMYFQHVINSGLVHQAIKPDRDRRPKGRDGRRKKLHWWTPYHRTPIRLNCPLEDCPARNIARLDRHLHRMHDIQTANPEYAALMSKAKATVGRTSTSNVTNNWMQQDEQE